MSSKDRCIISFGSPLQECFFLPSTKHALRDHITKVHERRHKAPRKCKICGISVANYVQLHRHTNIVHFPER